MTYDALDRPNSRTYTTGADTAATDSVGYTYDQDVLGTLYSVSTTPGTGSSAPATSNVYLHDAFGRVTTSKQTVGSAGPFQFGYSWTLSDQLTQMVYHSGRTVNYTLDSSDRVTGIAAGSTYAQNISYTAAGTLSSMQLGNAVTETHSWNDRFQETGVTAGSMLSLNMYPCQNGLTACASGNSGRVYRQTIGIGGTIRADQEFAYDNLNRLTKAMEKGTTGFDINTAICPDASSSWCEQGFDINAAVCPDASSS